MSIFHDLLDRNAFCKIARLVHVLAAEYGGLISQQLERHNSLHRLEEFRGIRNRNQVVGMR